MDERVPIPNTQALAAILDRLGANRPGGPQVSLKRLRNHIAKRMPGGYRGDDSVLEAIDSIHAIDRFRATGVHRLLEASPSLRMVRADEGWTTWHVRLDLVLCEDPPIRAPIRGEIPDDVVPLLADLPLSEDFERDMARVASLVESDARTRIDRIQAKARSWKPKLDAALAACGPRAAALAAAMNQRLSSSSGVPDHPRPEQVLTGVLNACLNHAMGIEKEARSQDRLRSVVGYADYVAHIKASRPARKVVFHVGPTNSGKTHDAMQALAAAGTGLYLAPLRLLALEGYERLRDAGLAAGMVTGEEVIDAEGATHLAQTIETASLRRDVEVAVIDEIQLLTDDERGWAWTRALFGLRCRTLMLCGSEDAMPLVLRAAEILGETVEVVRHERKTPLHVQPGVLSVREIRAGDAVIAFSRRDVHYHREILLQRGMSVATVYGALSPEVRRAEAARFRSGEAAVLVATDAIGMGLNLGPLRRVVFTELSKYDGVSQRPLTPSEIRQIAGRAGRFGHHEAGYVAVMTGSARKVETALTVQEPVREGDGRFAVRPEPEVIEAAAREIGSTSLVRILGEFAKRTVYEGSPFKPADVDETIEAAKAIDGLDLSIVEKFAFAVCPIDRRSHEARTRLWQFATARAEGRVAPLPRSRGPGRPYGAVDLMDHEDEVKLLSAYLWLARRFPETFPDGETVRSLRAEANRLIEGRLSDRATAKARKVSAR